MRGQVRRSRRSRRRGRRRRCGRRAGAAGWCTGWSARPGCRSRSVRRAGDQVALPVARLGAVGHGRGSLADHRHGGASVLGCGHRLGVWSSTAAPGAQGAARVPAQDTVPGVDRLVDGLPGQVARRLAGEGPTQVVGDLLRAPRLVEQSLDVAAQEGVPGEPTIAWAGAPLEGLAVRQGGAVVAGLGAVATDLAADRRRRPAELAPDRPQADLGADPVGRSAAVRPRTGTARRRLSGLELRRGHGRIVQVNTRRAGDGAPEPPACPRLAVNPDESARFGVVHPRGDQSREFLSLLRQRRDARPPSSRPARSHNDLQHPGVASSTGTRPVTLTGSRDGGGGARPRPSRTPRSASRSAAAGWWPAQWVQT